MFKKLEGKTAVITGGTEGIGWLRQNFSSKSVPMSSLRTAGNFEERIESFKNLVFARRHHHVL
jgi:hypothetical protein